MPGKKRNYPPFPLAEALKVAEAIADKASGMKVSRLTLSGLLDTTPSSSNFTQAIASSRAFGLTTGGINADEFELTELGQRATSADEVEQAEAYKAAVMQVPVFKVFFEAFASKRYPTEAPFKEFLVKNAGVDPSRAEDCMNQIMANARVAGLIRQMKGGGEWVDLDGVPVLKPGTPDEPQDGIASEDEAEELAEEADPSPELPTRVAARDGTPKKVFVAHGKNRTPLDQLKKALDQFKVKYAVAVDEPHKGRPISEKVANLMRDECSSAIFIFTADERFLKEDEAGKQEEVWRPSENVVYELGAASILYDRRIVIFKEKRVTFPSDYSDLGYIEFEEDQLVAELGALFSELVGLDILEVRAKS